MPLKITRGSDPIEVKTIVAMLYAVPGSGKTSTAFTSQTPLLLDCDNGAYRSAFRKDAVQVQSWADIANITADDLRPYDTVAVDTVGRLLDFLAADIIESNPKMGNRGALSLQGYGQLKSRFASWVKHLRTLGKDIILIAHDKEEKRGDDTVFRPDIQGGSYGEVMKVADAVGYMYMGDKGRTLDFSPTAKWEGKNVAGLPPLLIPDYKSQPAFFAGVIQQIKDSMNQLSSEGKMIADMVSHERVEIEKAATAEELTKLVGKANGLLEAAQAPVKRLIMQHAKTLGLKFDQKAGAFVEAQAA